MKTARDAPAVPPPEDHAPASGPGAGIRRLVNHPLAIVGVILAISLTVGWQFITDSSRGVPAGDTAWYQWRAEFIQDNDPGRVIELEGAQGALAGGYRVAEPVLAALMRTVGGVGPETPTVVLSVAFRVLAAVAIAAFAWRYRRNRLLLYLTLATVPPLFLLQQFFGFLDNFFALTMVTGALLLLDRMRGSGTAKAVVTAFLFVAAMSHPTTLVLFLLSIGAVIGWRVIRERSLLAGIRAEGPILVAGTAAVFLMVAFWMGGLWGPTAGLGEAAVPPPEDVPYFVDRSLNVLDGMYPWVFIPVMVVGLGALVVSVFRDRERFAELTVAWTLPLAGVFGFLIGAAYPYFRFFNATMAPLLATALGFAVLIGFVKRLAPRRLLAPVAAGALVAVTLGFWWSAGLSSWNTKPGWNTPEVRTTTTAARAYLDAEPADRRALFVVDARPEGVVPYGRYKEYTNSIYAGLDGDQIDRSFVHFGSIDDIREGSPTATGVDQYDSISADTATSAKRVLERHTGNLVVFVPAVFNDPSPNVDAVAACAGCTRLGDTGVYLDPDAGATSVSEEAAAAAVSAAGETRAFVADPPGPLSGLGGTLLSILRLGLLVVPGWLLYRRIPGRSGIEGLALVPLLSVAALSSVGMITLAVLRGPLSVAVGWGILAITLALILALPPLWRRIRPFPERIVRESVALLRKRDFAGLMGAQWLAQAADGLVGVALAKHIVFGGQAGFSPEEARTPEDALRIVLLTFLPYMLLSPFLGVLSDRFDRRRLLLAANGTRVAVLLLIALLGLETVGDPALFGSFLLILAGTRVVLVVKGAGLPAVLGERDLIQGNSISQAGSALFQLGGAGTALVVAGFLPTRLILMAGVVGYGLATASASIIKRLGYPRERVSLAAEARRILGDLAEGVGEVSRRPMAGLALASFLSVRTLLTLVVLSTGFASRELLAGEGTLTTAIPAATGALGAGIGFVLAHVAKERVPPVRIVVGALSIGGAGLIAFGGIITIPGVSLVALVVGLAFFLGKISVDTLMQQSLADAFRGRGFGLQDVIYNLSWVLPALFLWAVWSEANARGILAGAGVVFLLAAGAIALWGRVASRAPVPAPVPE